jgi:hypothetical protein
LPTLIDGGYGGFGGGGGGFKVGDAHRPIAKFTTLDKAFIDRHQPMPYRKIINGGLVSFRL